MFVEGEFLLQEANEISSRKTVAFNCMASETLQWIECLLNSYRALNFTDIYTYMLELYTVTRRNAIDTPQ